MTVPNSDAVLSDDVARFYELRNGVRGEDGKYRLVVHGFAPCTLHDDAGKRCREYDARPESCRTFPSLPEQIEGTPCSHWFERTLPDGTTERRGGLGSPYPSPPRFGA